MFTVLTICTGNICRSPAVEFLLRDALGPAVRVLSAGTHALVGHGVDPQMAALLPMDTSTFAAQQLTPRLVREADLILGLTRAHRGRAVELYPAAVRRAFTLREFARIVGTRVSEEGTPSATLVELTRRAPELRVAAKAAESADDDIADPFRQDDDIFTLCHAEITAAVDAIAGAVRGQADKDDHSWWTKEAL